MRAYLRSRTMRSVGLNEQSQSGLVSVVLPTYNRAGTLARAVRSVLGQTYRNIELIVVDDGSNDETANVIESFDDPRLKYIPFAVNRGASAARNEGLRAATGEFIAFQDSDDEWLNEKLETQIAAARSAGSDAVAVFHMKVVYGRDESRVYGDGRVCCVPQLTGRETQQDFIKISHKQNLISPQTLLFSRSCLEKTGLFDILLKNSVDWDFALRLVYNAKVVFLNEPLVMTYIQPDSISTLKRSAARSQLRILLKLRRYSDVDPVVLADHYGRIGTSIGRLGKRSSGDRLLRKSVALAPTRFANWARLVANMLPLRTQSTSPA